MEVAATPPPSTVRHETPNAMSARYTTPVQTIPIVIVHPASTRPEPERDLSEEEERVWEKQDWRRLETCLLKERKNLAKEKGLRTAELNIDELDPDVVVEAFIEDESLYEEDLVGDWSRYVLCLL